MLYHSTVDSDQNSTSTQITLKNERWENQEEVGKKILQQTNTCFNQTLINLEHHYFRYTLKIRFKKKPRQMPQRLNLLQL